MSDLEEMGYILQPHTSAGRIPSDKGYRFYVDTMLGEREREVEELKGLLLEKDEKMDTLLKRSGESAGDQHQLCGDDHHTPVSAQ